MDANPHDSKLVIDEVAREIRVGERVLRVSQIEFDLLALFVANPRRLIRREELRLMWKYQDVSNTAIEQAIHSIRRHIIGQGRITTVRGLGYRYDPPSKAEETLMRACWRIRRRFLRDFGARYWSTFTISEMIDALRTLDLDALSELQLTSANIDAITSEQLEDLAVEFVGDLLGLSFVDFHFGLDGAFWIRLTPAGSEWLASRETGH